MQLTYKAMLRLSSGGNSVFARISLMETRPPGFSNRNISLNTIGLSTSGTRFITQLLMTQSTESDGRWMEVIEASMNDTLEMPEFSAFLRASSSMSYPAMSIQSYY